jgi:hypothetical protein
VIELVDRDESAKGAEDKARVEEERAMEAEAAGAAGGGGIGAVGGAPAQS